MEGARIERRRFFFFGLPGLLLGGAYNDGTSQARTLQYLSHRLCACVTERSSRQWRTSSATTGQLDRHAPTKTSEEVVRDRATTGFDGKRQNLPRQQLMAARAQRKNELHHRAEFNDLTTSLALRRTHKIYQK